MNSSKPAVTSQKILIGVLALLQTCYPLVASAAQYIQMMPVHDLVVTNGAALATVNVDASNTTTTSTLAGNAVLKAAPSRIDFGTVVTGTRATAQTMTLSNLGGAPAVLGTLATNAQFAVTDNCDGVTLPSLGTCQVNVTFAPTQVALGGLWGTLSIPFTSGTAAATALLGLQGSATWPTGALASTLQTAVITGFTGSDPSMTLNASGQPQISFADALAGQQYSSKSFNIGSGGNAPVTFSGLQFSDGAGATSGADGWAVTSADGSYSASSNCPALIAAGTGCTVTVTFAPSSPGTKYATLNAYSSSMAGNVMQVVLEGSAPAQSAFSLSTTQLNFAGVSVGQASTQSVAVLNTGNTPLSNPVIAATGSFFSSTQDCQSTLAVGASCTVSVNFAPTSVANVYGSLSVSFDIAGSKATTLSGQGLGPMLSVDALSQNFGSVVVGASASRTYTLSNDGNVPAPLSFGALPSDMARSGDCSATIAVGAVCHLVLTYSPTSVTPLSSTIAVSSALNTLNLGFVGTATYSPSFALSSSVVNFGAIDVNSSSTQQLTVLNNGSAALGAPTVQVTGAGYSASHNCTSNMAPGASCSVSLTFAPSARQAYAGQVSVAFTNASAQSASLTGSGRGALLGVDFDAQSFSGVTVGATAALTYVLVNSGDFAAALTFGALPSVVTRSGTCGASLDVGANCTVVLTFAPVVAGPVSGSLSVSSPTSSTALSYDGAGVGAPAFSLSSTSVVFGNVSILDSSALSVRLTNSGNVSLSTASVSISGASAYSVSHNCPATLGVGNYCDATVTFAPTGAGATVLGTLSLSYAQTSAQTVALAGTGVANPSFSLSATNLDLGIVNVGSSASLNTIVTNSGNVTLSGLVLSIAGSGYSQSNTCASTLAVGANCVVTVTLTPSAAQSPVPGTLTVTATSVASQPVSLTGVGAVTATPDPYYANVSLMLAFDGNLSDVSATPLTPTALGGAVISVTDPKYGSGSLALTGAAGAYVNLPSSNKLSMGATTDFTEEMWVFPTAAKLALLWANWDCANSVGDFEISVNPSGNLQVVNAGVDIMAAYGVTTNHLTQNAWNHVALTRAGNVYRMFINGTLGWSETRSGLTWGNTKPSQIGSATCNINGPYNFAGRIDDLRVTKGAARYTSNFTVPTAAF